MDRNVHEATVFTIDRCRDVFSALRYCGDAASEGGMTLFRREDADFLVEVDHLRRFPFTFGGHRSGRSSSLVT